MPKPPLPPSKLLSRFAVTDTEMGISYERSLSSSTPLGASSGEARSTARGTLVCPRGSSRAEIAIAGPRKAIKLDATQVLWAAPGTELEVTAQSAILDVMRLYPSPRYLSDLIEDNGLGPADRDRLAGEPIVIKRTRWLDDILDRYFFERVMNRHSPPGCVFFLEKQILNELARIVFREKLATWATREDSETEGFDGAIRFIEANLFERLDLARIAEASRQSESSLLRGFKKELGKTPYGYIKERRLDEAMGLLKAGDRSVGDVAVLVGYEDIGAFGKAFRERFGKQPSSFLPKRSC